MNINTHNSKTIPGVGQLAHVKYPAHIWRKSYYTMFCTNI